MARAKRTLTNNRDSAQVFLLAVCTIGGIIGMIAPRAVSTSLSEAFPGGLEVVWFLGLAATSIGALGGMVLGSVAGLLWERVALGMQALLLVAYAAAVAGFSHGFDGGLGAMLFYVGFASHDAYRAWRITLIIRVIPEAPDG